MVELRILLIHADFFEYSVRQKAVEGAEELKNEGGSFGESLVCFVSVEEGDGEGGVARRAAEEIYGVAESLGISFIVLYPYAHLSQNLSDAEEAKTVLGAVEINLRDSFHLDVHRAPFGWYKSFKISNKGHPLAELSRAITPEEVERLEIEVKKDKFQKFIILDVDGTEYELVKDNWDSCHFFKEEGRDVVNMKYFVRNELVGKRGPSEEPSHIELMRRLELVSYAPESDAGHMKWFPNGVLIKDLIMDYALNKIALPWGAVKMQNPLLYRTDVEAISKLQGEFHERDYLIRDRDRKLVLRFASDPGAFPFVQKLSLSYRNMPFKIYEEAICFRKEQKGELTGLMRVRNFWMTDQHAFCANEEQAFQEYETLTLLFAKLMKETIAGDNWVLGFEVVSDFFERYKAFFKNLVRKVGKPAFVKLMGEMTHYYAFKNEFQSIFANGDNLQISTVQWDVKNGERFNITFVNKEGERLFVPIIIHASSFGSIERAIAAMLENAERMKREGMLPMLPLWLSPEQVRIIPVSNDRHLKRCEEIAGKLEASMIRVSVDDRELTVSRKVMEAKKSWVPYVVVVGDKELGTDMLPIVIRELSTLKEERRELMSLEDFITTIRRKTSGMPFRPLYQPRELSRRVSYS
ncbi:MAG: threonine--tRNA ligase [Candidatus Bathyarchaeia archaeon]